MADVRKLKRDGQTANNLDIDGGKANTTYGLQDEINCEDIQYLDESHLPRYYGIPGMFFDGGAAQE